MKKFLLSLMCLVMSIVAFGQTDTVFYSTCYRGGTAGLEKGTILEFLPSTNSTRPLLNLTDSIGTHPRSTLVMYNGKYYGVNEKGGFYNKGCIFEWDPTTNVYTKMIDFNGQALGSRPFAALTLYDGKFYGTAYEGGMYYDASHPDGFGTIFEWDPNTNVITKRYDFKGNAFGDGAWPWGSMVEQDGILYGMTSQGGNNDCGVIFQYDPTTHVYTKRMTFVQGTSGTGTGPTGQLLYYGGLFYGMTQVGGTNGNGTLFAWNPTTNAYVIGVNFSGTAGTRQGKTPFGSLVEREGKLYGMTYCGGANDWGVIFEWDPSSNAYSSTDLDSLNGGYPMSAYSLVFSNGWFYATTSFGGTSSPVPGNGVVFKWNPDTKEYVKLYDLTNATGKEPHCALSAYTISTPSAQASDVTFSNLQASSVTVRWTNGDGAKRVVFVKQDTVGSVYPFNHTAYTANSVFGMGTQVGLSGWYCVYNGTGDSVNVTNLVQGQGYRVKVCEYNGFSYTIFNNTVVSHEMYKTTDTVGDPTTLYMENTGAVVISTESIPTVGGSTSGYGTYSVGDTVTISAVADSAYDFLFWKLNDVVVTDSANYSFVASSTQHYAAHFQLKPPTLVTITVNSSYGGSVSGGGIYEFGDTVTALAIPDSGFVFTTWTENENYVSSDSSYVFQATVNRTIRANFDTILVNPDPPEGGYVYYIYGLKSTSSTITVVAVPNPGWAFYGWTQDCKMVSTDTAYTFVTDSGVNLVAHFYEVGESFVVLTDVSPVDGGYTTGGCDTYDNGTDVTLTAYSNPGYEFRHWVNDEGSAISDSSQIIVRDENVHLTAVFAQINDVPSIDQRTARVYPNPATSTVTVDWSAQAKDVTVIIVNSISQIVYSERVSGLSTKLSINVDGYRSGMYYVTVISDGKKFSCKLIKQ